MSELGPLLNLNLGVPGRYEISPEFDQGLRLPPGGLLGDPVIEVPPVVVTGTRPVLLSDEPLDFSMPDNQLTRLLGVAPGPDPTRVAMSGIWQDPNASAGAKFSAGTVLTGLNLRDFFVSTPIDAVHELGSILTNGLDRGGRLIADLAGPHADVAWNAKVMAPAARIGDQLSNIGDQISTFADATPLQRREMVWQGVNDIANTSTLSIRNDWNQGNVGGLLGKVALTLAGGYGGYLAAGGSSLLKSTLADQAVVALGETQSPVGGTVSKEQFRPWGELDLQRIHKAPQINGQLVEPVSGGSPLVRNWTIERFDPSGQNTAGLFVRPPEGQRIYRIGIADPNPLEPGASSAFGGGARLEPNWNGLGPDSVWAKSRFGVREDVDASGAVRNVPDVPPGTARLDDVHSSPNLPGSGQQAVKLSLQLAQTLGQRSVVGTTDSPFVVGRFSSYEAPGPFSVETTIPSSAPDRILNYWARMVNPDARPTTWVQARVRNQDQQLLDIAGQNHALSRIDPVTGLSPYETMAHNFNALRAGDPMVELRRLPLQDQLLFPEGSFRYDFGWQLPTPPSPSLSNGLQDLWRLQEHSARDPYGFRM